MTRPGDSSNLSQITACQKKISGSGHATETIETATSTLPTNPSVDKPMHIHRIECAKPANLVTAGFLSSFGPCQTQVLCKRFDDA
jgi:hypothetical protein